jgi:tight adherence protein B
LPKYEAIVIVKIIVTALFFISVFGLAYLAWDFLPALRRALGEKLLQPLRARLEDVSVTVASHRLALVLAGLSLFLAILLTILLETFWAFPLGAMLGALAPWIWVRTLENRRKEKFALQLLDSVQTLASALKAGQSLAQAVGFTGRESPEPSASFFKGMAQQVQLGQSVDQALEFQARAYQGSSCQGDLNLLCSAVAINRSAGGNLAETLEKLAETIRERARLRGQIQALTAQGRLSGWVVGLLPLGLLLVLQLLDPTMVEPLYTTPLGWGMLGVAVVMEGLGALVIRKIVNIEV